VRKRFQLRFALRGLFPAVLGICIGALHFITAIAEPVKVPRVGVLMIQADQPLGQGLREGLRELGYVEGKTIAFDWRGVDPVQWTRNP
jgi:hypothetical protein